MDTTQQSFNVAPNLSLAEQLTSLRKKSIADLLQKTSDQPLYQSNISRFLSGYADHYLQKSGEQYTNEDEAIDAHNAMQEYQKQGRKIRREMVQANPTISKAIDPVSKKNLTDEYFKIESQILTSLAKFSKNVYEQNGMSYDLKSTLGQELSKIKKTSILVSEDDFETMRNSILNNICETMLGRKLGENGDIEQFYTAMTTPNAGTDPKSFAKHLFTEIQQFTILNPNTAEITTQAFPDIGYNFSDYQVEQRLNNPQSLKVNLEEQYEKDRAIGNKRSVGGPSGFVDFFKSASAFNNDFWNYDEHAYWGEYNRTMRDIREEKNPEVRKKANRNAAISTMLLPPIVPVAAVTKGISMGLSYIAKPFDLLANKLLNVDNGITNVLGGALKLISLPLKLAATVVNFTSNILMTIASSITKLIHKSAQKRLSHKISRGVKKQMKMKEKMKKQYLAIEAQQKKLEELKGELLQADNDKAKNKINSQINSLSADLMKNKQSYMNNEAKFNTMNEQLEKWSKAREQQLEKQKKRVNPLAKSPLSQTVTQKSGQQKPTVVAPAVKQEKKYERLTY